MVQPDTLPVGTRAAPEHGRLEQRALAFRKQVGLRPRHHPDRPGRAARAWQSHGHGIRHRVFAEGQIVANLQRTPQPRDPVIAATAKNRLGFDAAARKEIAVDAAVGSAEIEQLLSQAHFKRPHDGVIFGWHQDIQHRDKGPGTWTDINGRGSFVQTLIVLDEMTADSGPLMFIPGSAQWGPVDFGDHDYDRSDYEPKRPPQFHEEEAVTITAMPGDTLFFGPYTAHASFENRSGRYRRVFINGYAYPGANARVYPGDGAGRTLVVKQAMA